MTARPPRAPGRRAKEAVIHTQVNTEGARGARLALSPTPALVRAPQGRECTGQGYLGELLGAWPSGAARPVEPVPTGSGEPAREALTAAIAGHDPILVEGQVGTAQPDLLELARAEGRRVVLVVHTPVLPAFGPCDPDRSELVRAEGRAVRAAWRVLVPSDWVADELARRHGRVDVVVVRPGAHPGELATPHTVPGILQVGAFAPLHNQLLTFRALRGCASLPWSASFVGPSVDDEYAARLAAEARALPGGRVRLTGRLAEGRRSAEFARADLVVAPAAYETAGLAVTEALAHGIPVVVGRGTAAEELLTTLGDGAGAAVSVTEPDELTAVLRRWLSDPRVRVQWRAQARAARSRLRTWGDAAIDVARVCAGIPPGPLR